MGRGQNIKILIGLIVISLLLGFGVLLSAYFNDSFSYSIQDNLLTNSDYYPSMTAEHENAQFPEEESGAE